ncbi:hypothetical protein QVD17_00857 [Tagetes erecta]|uniref:Uncharacterized protein n=1 Tax=Tagetes erecta TaxID=13708 RepID=A0AAD8L5B5_TARER|nr:hypothetical protein QVD17_00857 [Tagetes erecta]
MEKSSKLLDDRNKDCCSIYKVPERVVEINKDAYEPQIVSIGPYHHGRKGLEMIEQHKWRFLNDVITRTGNPLALYVNYMLSMEKEIRESYSSESIDHIGSNDLAKMMLLDGFFLIELFLKFGDLVPTHPDDPIFKMVWVSSVLRRDLLRLENQIPFVVLKKLFNHSKPNVVDTPRTLQSLILHFFNTYLQVTWPSHVLKHCEMLDGKHLLDFFRNCFIHANANKRTNTVVSKPIFDSTQTQSPSFKLIRPATKLSSTGVKFEANHQTHI